MFGIGVQELLVVLIIVLVLFGGKKIPELSRSIGEMMREMRLGITGELDESLSKKPVKKKKTANK